MGSAGSSAAVEPDLLESLCSTPKILGFGKLANSSWSFCVVTLSKVSGRPRALVHVGEVTL